LLNVDRQGVAVDLESAFESSYNALLISDVVSVVFALTAIEAEGAEKVVEAGKVWNVLQFRFVDLQK